MKTIDIIRQVRQLYGCDELTFNVLVDEERSQVQLKLELRNHKAQNIISEAHVVSFEELAVSRDVDYSLKLVEDHLLKSAVDRAKGHWH